MYSYQHRYHAGNFADIHKHIILIAILNALQRKDTPFCVLDAFAGEGIYDLGTKESQKNNEHLNGFCKINNINNKTDLIQELIEIPKFYQNKIQQFIYPGSPAIICFKLRKQDQAIFIENHPQAHMHLKKFFGKNKQIHIHKRDAIEAINALIPFKQKRGLIFIDPSYEIKEEYNIISDLIINAHSKFLQGIYMIWYPLLKEGRHINLVKKISNNFDNLWQHEFAPFNNDSDFMYGSGVIVVNPPWRFEQKVLKSLQILRRFFI